MEKLHFWKIATISLLLFFLFACSKRQERSPNSIKGHWYVTYGDSIKMYGEVIYENNHFCSYSDEFGLVYREFKIKDSVIEIYNRGKLDHKRLIVFLDSNVMMQTLILNDRKAGKPIKYQKISPLDIQKIFAGDTTEQSKYIDGFILRKAFWERENSFIR